MLLFGRITPFDKNRKTALLVNLQKICSFYYYRVREKSLSIYSISLIIFRMWLQQLLFWPQYHESQQSNTKSEVKQWLWCFLLMLSLIRAILAHPVYDACCNYRTPALLETILARLSHVLLLHFCSYCIKICKQKLDVLSAY